MDKKVRQAYLYDFYGELLNEHQRRIYEDVVYNDLSLSEIADQEEISRQAVFDMLRRLDKKLAAYEAKLHLVEKFLSIQEDVEAINLEITKMLQEKASDFSDSEKQSLLLVEQLSAKIMEQL